MSTLADHALAEAVAMVGQRENPPGSNWGHPVQDFLASVNIFQPSPWCMAFMYWSFQHAAGQLGVKNPLVRTGKVKTQWISRPDYQLVIGPDGRLHQSVVLPGDIFIMLHEDGSGHCGLVEFVNADQSLRTIEGNTNLAGSREGIEVERRQRTLRPPMVGLLRF